MLNKDNNMLEGDNKRSTYIQEVKDGSMSNLTTTSTFNIILYIHVANLKHYLVHGSHSTGKQPMQVQY